MKEKIFNTIVACLVFGVTFYIVDKRDREKHRQLNELKHSKGQGKSY